MSVGEIKPPKKGFSRFIVYREPYEKVDIWLVFPDEDETYRIDLDYLRSWMLPLFSGNATFVEMALDHIWNFYHVELKPGKEGINTLPLSDAYDYNLGGDGLDQVAKIANKRRPGFFV